MIVLHEIEEIIIGDITPFDNVSHEEKLKEGEKAVKFILGDLIKAKEYEELLREFNERTTKEAAFAYMCDKLEADLQVKIYEEEGYNDLNDVKSEKVLSDSRVQKKITDGAVTISEIFMVNDKYIFENSKSFFDIFEYAKKNNILDLREINDK